MATGTTDVSSLQRIHERVASTTNDELPKVLDKLLPKLLPMLNTDSLREHVLPLISHIMKRVKELKCVLPIASLLRNCIAPSSFCCNVTLSFINIALSYEPPGRLADCATALLEAISTVPDRYSPAMSPLLFHSIQLLPHMTELSSSHAALLASYYIDVALLQPGMGSQGVGSVRPGLTTQRLSRLQHLISLLTPPFLLQQKLTILHHAQKLNLPYAVLIYCIFALDSSAELSTEANYKLKHLHANQTLYDDQTLCDTVYYIVQACSIGIPSVLSNGRIITESSPMNESLDMRTPFSDDVTSYVLHWAYKDFPSCLKYCLSLYLHVMHYHFLVSKQSKSVQLQLLKIANHLLGSEVDANSALVFHSSALAVLETYVGMTSRSNELDRDSLIRKESYNLLDALYHLPKPCSFSQSTVSLLFNLLDLEDGVGHGARVTEGYRLLGRLKDQIQSTWSQDELATLLPMLVLHSRTTSMTCNSKRRMAVQWILALFPYSDDSIDMIVTFADDKDTLISTTVNSALKALQTMYSENNLANVTTEHIYARLLHHAQRLQSSAERQNIYPSVIFTLTLILHSVDKCSCPALLGNSSGKQLYNLYVRQYNYSVTQNANITPALINGTLSLIHEHLLRSTKYLVSSIILLYRHISMHASPGNVKLKEITIALLSAIDHNASEELPYCVGYSCLPSIDTSMDVVSISLSALGLSSNDHEGYVAHLWRILLHKHQHPATPMSTVCSLRCVMQVVIALQDTSLFSHYQIQLIRLVQPLLQQHDCYDTALHVIYVLLKQKLLSDDDASLIFKAIIIFETNKLFRITSIRVLSLLALSFPQLHNDAMQTLKKCADTYTSCLNSVEARGNVGGVVVNDASEIQFQLSIADAIILGLTRGEQLCDNKCFELLDEIHYYIKIAPTFLSLLLLRLLGFMTRVSPKSLLQICEVVIDVMRCGGEKSSVRRNICCAVLCGIYDLLNKCQDTFDAQLILADKVIAALTRQVPIAAQRAPGMSDEPNVVNVTEIIQSITNATAPMTTFASPQDANETVGVYTTLCSIAKKSKNVSVLFPLLSSVQSHVRSSVSQTLTDEANTASGQSTGTTRQSQHWNDMEGFDFICDYWYPVTLKLLPHHSVSQLVPLLYAAKFHPNASIKQIMRDVWNQLLPNSQETLLQHSSDILKHLVSNINNKDWKYRECCCAGIEAMLPNRNEWKDVSFCVEDLWRAGIEVVADVRDSVKLAGAGMMKALADLVVRSVDSSLNPDSEIVSAAIDTMLPLILRGVEGSGPEARGISLGLLLRIVKVAGSRLGNHTTGVITLLVESMSALEPRTLQYMQFHINKMSISEQEYEDKRLQLSRSTPMQEALDDCLQILTPSTLTPVVHSLVHLAQTGVGIATRSAALRSLLTISHTYTAPMTTTTLICTSVETPFPISEIHFVVQSLLNSIWRTTNASLQSDHLAVISACMPRCQVEFVLLLCRQLLAFHDSDDSDAQLMAQLISIMMNKCGDHIVEDECIPALVVMAYCGSFTETKVEGTIVEDTSVHIWRKVFSDILSIASFDKAAALDNNMKLILLRVQRLLKHLSYVARCNGLAIVKDLHSTIGNRIYSDCGDIVAALMLLIPGPYWMGKERVFETLLLFKDRLRHVEGVCRLEKNDRTIVICAEHLQSRSVVTDMLNTNAEWTDWCFGIDELLDVYLQESQKGDEQYRIGIAKCINRLPLSTMLPMEMMKHFSKCLNIISTTTTVTENVPTMISKVAAETKTAPKMDVFGSRYGTSYAPIPRKVKQRSDENLSVTEAVIAAPGIENSTSSAAYRVQIIEIMAKMWPSVPTADDTLLQHMKEKQIMVLLFLRSQLSNTVWSIRKACYTLLSRLAATMHILDSDSQDSVSMVLQLVAGGVNDAKYSQIRVAALIVLRSLMAIENKTILTIHIEEIRNILKLARAESEGSVLAEFASNAEQLRTIGL